jgi:hypothetical protein
LACYIQQNLARLLARLRLDQAQSGLATIKILVAQAAHASLRFSPSLALQEGWHVPLKTTGLVGPELSQKWFRRFSACLLS